MSHQPKLIPDQPSPDQAARDAEREEYLEKLRQYLQDPAFRAIEGFPIGEDEDILALSDPPYYTACPNPFLPEIIERWQTERVQIREELGLPDDSDDNGNGGEPVYHREPFATDVSEGRYAPESLAHSYHTKTPARAIMRYILHYTDPGDVIFDGFCGTGMTGIAAQFCGNLRVIEELGYQVQRDGEIIDDEESSVAIFGARKAVLADLAPAATFIAYNYNMPIDVATFRSAATRVLQQVEAECAWMYETLHVDGVTKGRINYTVWSDVFLCPECSEEIIFWDAAVDQESENVRGEFSCPHCDASLDKRSVERIWETFFDALLGQIGHRAKQVPVAINYSIGRERFDKKPDSSDLELLEKIATIGTDHLAPSDKMLFRDGVWGDQWREGYHGCAVTHTHHFYTKRNLLTLAAYRHYAFEALDKGIGMVLTATALKLSRLARYMFDAAGRIQNGVLYLPSLYQEMSPFLLLEVAPNYIGRYRRFTRDFGRNSVISTGSSSDISILPSASIDYIFVDPPFGSNLMYSELNFLWESWLRVFTCSRPEAIVSKTQGKALPEYQELVMFCFQECHRVLKPGRWMTIQFHNSQSSVWNSIHEAMTRAGFVIADIRTLDKKQGAFNQVVTATAVKQDLVISAYKPRTGFERRFLKQAGSAEGAWDFVRQHLEQLPVVVEKDGVLEVVAERQAYLLYDRMVAFHIQRGFSVPLGAAEFYAGLKQRFPERDGMYFLPHQVAEYDRRRMEASRVEQLALFVADEKSAIQWLRQELDAETGSGPQTYQDIQPKFLRELHQARHEQLPELSEMLAQGFLQDEQQRWYVPDPSRQEDLEKLRERALLREFQEYAQGQGRLKVLRTEAVRAGFKNAWQERDYRLIVRVAERLPESVLQEDAALLMYYDNALMRAESEPVRGAVSTAQSTRKRT